jgi:hypothetical protein
VPKVGVSRVRRSLAILAAALAVAFVAFVIIRLLPLRRSAPTINVRVTGDPASAANQRFIEAQAKPNCRSGPRWQEQWFAVDAPSYVAVWIEPPVGRTLIFECHTGVLRPPSA